MWGGGGKGALGDFIISHIDQLCVIVFVKHPSLSPSALPSIPPSEG